MAKYAYVVNGVIEEVFDSIPKNWKNISNFYVLSKEERSIYGWCDVISVIAEYNPSTQYISNIRQYITDGNVYETADINNFTIETPVIEQLNQVDTSEDALLYQQQFIDAQWFDVRNRRDIYMTNFEWRYTRYDRQFRAGMTPTDDITKLDEYMQALADITNQTDPFAIFWPTFNG
jgi:hypothetical protein